MKEKLDIGVLLPILERIESECKHNFLSIGYSVQYHNRRLTSTDKELIETGEDFYEQFKLEFKRIEEYRADVNKIDQLIGTITKLSSKYWQD
jgi:dimeric dUTPase (all-alpha-NTP-PPase superfamily)